MDSTSNSYPSYYCNFVEQKGLEHMIDDGAYQHMTISSVVSSPQFEPNQNWVSQHLKDLMTVKAHIETKLRELQDLYHKQQDTLAQLSAFNGTTTTPTWNGFLPQPTSSPSSSTTPYVPNVTYVPAVYTTYNCARKKALGYETSQRREHVKKSYICRSCGKSYTRKDSLLRHAIVHGSPRPKLHTSDSPLV